MNRPKTLALATATTLLAGLGVYGATASFASSSDTAPRTTASATAPTTSKSKTNSKSTSNSPDAMIQQCVKYVPAKDRAAAQKQMREMMAGHDHASHHSTTSDHAGTSTGGMMGNHSADSMTGMMHGSS